MMTITNFVFDKTDRGREEIATRKHGLAMRLRTLLLMVDGKKSAHEVLEKVSGLGLSEENLRELINDNFIWQINIPPLNVDATATVQKEPVGLPKHQAEKLPAAPVADASIGNVAKLEGLTVIREFFSETIISVIGLRGFSLQIEAERAVTLEDFRGMRQPYFDAILKAKGA